MKNIKILISMLLGLILVTSITFATLSYIEEIDDEDYIKIELLKVGHEGFIFFSDGDNCTGIIARTSNERAKSIELGLDNRIEVRPNTHDIYYETIKHFNISLEKIIVSTLRDNHYYAIMTFKQDNRILEIDSKPSDAMALALRTNSSIYMNKTLYNLRKESIC